MNTRNCEKLANHLDAGRVYRREALLPFSTAIDRDLMTLVNKGLLEKLAPGIYYKPAQSRYGALPPKDHEMVRSFLRDDFFLLYSWNQYNALGLGLTQIYNRAVVYNRKRHGHFVLNGRTFDFRRPARGFPDQLNQEFLLIDLVNNLNELDENPTTVKKQINHNFYQFNSNKVYKYARQYGKIATRKFFEEIKDEYGFST